MNKKTKLVGITLNLLLWPLILISLIGSIQWLSTMLTKQNTIRSIVVVILVVLIIGGVSFLFKRGYRKLGLTLIVGLILGLQLLIVASLSGIGYWDPSYLTYRAVGVTLEPKVYFRYYPNTLTLYNFEKILWHLLGQPPFKHFVYILNIINIFIVDLGSLLIYLVVRQSKLSQAKVIALILLGGLILFSPWLVFFYSDTWGFLISAGFIYSLYRLSGSKRDLIIALLAGVGYFIKPSLVIFVIAYFLYRLVNISSQSSLISFGKSLLIYLVVFGGILLAGNRMIKNQIDTTRSFDSWHFMSMGLVGDGRFYHPDTEKNMEIKSPQARKAYNKRLVKQRLQNYGVKGYSKFLVHKQIMNTNKGTLGWGDESMGFSYFLVPFNHADDLREVIRKIYLSPRADFAGLGLVVQIIWIVMFLGSLFTSISDAKINIIKLTVIGFMMFLLLYEGGRCRYVIQYLPYLIMMGLYGIKNIYQRLRGMKSDIKN